MARAKSSTGVNHRAIGLGLVLGLGFGLLASASGSDVLVAAAVATRPLGNAFVNAIQMVVIPLVVVTVFLGVGRLGDPRKLGKLGALTLGLAWATYLPAIGLGILGMKVGLRFSAPVVAPAAEGTTVPELPGVVEYLVGLIPRNVFQAATDGALLPLILFTILLAAATGTLAEERRLPLFQLVQTLSDALIKLVQWILWTAPVGVFGLSAPITAESGWAMLRNLAVFVLTVGICLALLWGLWYLPWLRFAGGRRPLAFHRATLGTLAIGAGSTSSMASLPVMLQEAEDNLKLSPGIYPLALSLLAPLHKAGSALYQAAAVVFLAFVYDVPLPASALGGLFLAIFLVALTVAPVPSASVVTLAPALETVGVPLSGLVILLGVDRIPDMLRSAVNINGHMVWAVVVERFLEGRPKDPLQAVGSS